MLSIIIPARNEEENIEKLLKSIKRQYFSCEVILGNDNSTDKTGEIGRKYAKVINGKWGHPGLVRNACAKEAKGDCLLFLDADVILPRNFLKKNFEEFVKRDLASATTYVKPLSKRLDDKLIHGIGYNLVYFLSQKISPIAAGFCIFCKKSVFKKINGFDETITLGEDHDFVRRSREYGKFGILHGPKINVSIRRLETEGRIKYVLKMIYAGFYLMFKGPIHGNIKYTFDHKAKKVP